MPTHIHKHKMDAPASVRAAVLTVSSTRTEADDESGRWIATQLRALGHEVVFSDILPDDSRRIVMGARAVIREHRPLAMLVSGGTGISRKDVTIEALRPIFEKEMTGFAILFAMLSHAQVGSSAILSRATAGIHEGAAIFCMPGSLRACQLACESIIFPELGHLARHLKE